MAALSLILLLVFCCVEGGGARQDRWANLYDRALAQFNHGDFEAARKTVQPAYLSWDDPKSHWHWPFRLLLAESLMNQGRLRESAELLQDRAPRPEWEARRLVGIAFIDFRNHKEDAARKALDAVEAFHPIDAPVVAGQAELIRGMIYLRANDATRAEACFRRVLQAVSGTGSLVELQALIDLGVAYLNAYRNDEAVLVLDRAHVLAQRSGMQGITLLAYSNLGFGYQQLGDLDRSMQYLKDAEAIEEKLGDRVNLLRTLVSMGETALQMGDDGTAEKLLERAKGLASAGDDDEWLAGSLSDLSAIALAHDAIAAADRLNRESGEITERLPATITGPRTAQRIQSAEILAARGEYARAQKLFAAAIESSDPVSLWLCHAGQASAYRQMGRLAEAQREYRLAIATVEGQRSKLKQDEFKLTFLSHLIRFYGDYIDFLVDRGDKEEAFRVAQSCRARVLEEKQHQGDETSKAPDPAALNQAARASQSTVLSYWLAPRRSFLWALDGSKTDFFILPAEAEIAAHVRKYAEAIDRGANPLDTGDADARWLAEKILPPQYSELRGRNIVIEPDGALHQLNFESLPSGDGKRYWLEDATVSIAPSLALLRVAAAAPKRKLLLFGDPDFTGGDLPRLPNLKREIAAVTRQFSEKTVYTASDATPAAYDSSHPEVFSTLHFATHALANRESPLDSAIILAGPPETRKLYARDILRQPLNAELVTLSACQTAGSRTYYGEGSLGFAWAFLSAGARNVVAGLWEVDDRATASLMDRFYEAQAAGLSPAAALRKAKLELMASTPIYRKPRYWAAFETFTRALYR